MFRSKFVFIYTLNLFLFGMQSQEVRATSATIVPLTQPDFDLIEAGASCTLTSQANENYLYDNLSKGLVRYNSKAYVLKRAQGSWDQGFYKCGQSYSYVSEDEQLKVKVDMTKSKKKNGPCKGNLTVTLKDQKATINKLTSNCGD